MSGVLFIVTVPKIEFEKRQCVIDKNDREPSADNGFEFDSNKSVNNLNDDEQGNNNLIDLEVKGATRSDDTQLDIETEKPIRRSLKSFPSQLAPVAESVKEIQSTYDGSIDTIPIEKIIKEVLKALKITDAAWSESLEGTHWQVTFSVSGRARSERALKTLRGAGLGARPLTTLCVLPCALHYKSTLTPISTHISGECQEEDEGNQTAWGAFVNSVRARQTVAQVVENIKADAALTFDFLFLLIIASIVAAIGLVENSTVFLVASMLISPLMGPIMAGTFGTALRDKELLKMGVKHELLGLFLVSVIGFLFGLVICSIDETYGDGEWQTYEITSRCDLRSLWVGALVAVPSGAAVAIAILSGNTSSLVGVAISASLLPPAVNAGLHWAMAAIQSIHKNKIMFKNFVKSKTYSDDPAEELAINGSISMCLTLVNIVFIYIAGIVVYKIKEVAPTNSNDEQFWKVGIKAVRDYNKTATDDVKSQGNKHGIKDNSTLRQNDRLNYEMDIGSHDLLDRLRFMGNSHMTWSPHPVIARRVSAKEIYGYYRQFSEDPAARQPRLSFPVNQLPGFKRLNEESVPDIFSATEKPLSKSTSGSKGSKFTVIPVDETKSKESI